MVDSAVLTAQMGTDWNLRLPPMLVNTSPNVWIKRLGDHADFYALRKHNHQRQISGSHRQENVQKGIHPGFSDQGQMSPEVQTKVSVVPGKGQYEFFLIFLKKSHSFH